MDETERQQQRFQTNNKYLIKFLNFLKMTLQLLLPISVVSLFISHLSILMTLERKYMFLICNGIVALLFKSFAFSDSTTISPTLSETRYQESAKRTLPEIKEDHEDEYKDIVETEDNEEPGKEEYGQDLQEVGLIIPVGCEEDDVDMSTEELNRRFDEFIRKTKEELRIGARQQQLVTG